MMVMPTIVPPPTHVVIANANADPALMQRYEPAERVEREIDLPRPSAYPSSRRFETIYPGTRASDEATNAAFAAARDHDRSSSSGLLDLLSGRKIDDE